jgi:hypothetical protein
VGLAEAEKVRRFSCESWTRCSFPMATASAPTGLLVCGAKAAAWQNAQVASSWIGTGSDSRRELITLAEAAEEANGTDAGLPSAR